MLRTLSLGSFFSVHVGELENLNFTAASAKTATMFIWAACIGMLLASLYNFYQRAVPGSVVRALLRAEALSAESAKTAEELGLADKPFALFELTSGVTLRRVVYRTDLAEGIAPGKQPCTAETRFYLPEESKYRAEIRFSKEGNGVVALILTALLCVGVGIALVKLLPVVLGIIDTVLK